MGDKATLYIKWFTEDERFFWDWTGDDSLDDRILEFVERCNKIGFIYKYTGNFKRLKINFKWHSQKKVVKFLEGIAERETTRGYPIAIEVKCRGEPGMSFHGWFGDETLIKEQADIKIAKWQRLTTGELIEQSN